MDESRTQEENAAEMRQLISFTVGDELTALTLWTKHLP